MTEMDELAFTRGGDAARVVAADPFWSTVVRRHGDVDVVVLPPEDAPIDVEVPADEPLVDAEAARQGLRADMAALWVAIGLAGEPTHLDDTWFAGAAEGTLRWQGTATFDDLDPIVASAALDRTQEGLTEADGWHLLVPPAGIPRALAGRAGRLAREEVQVLVPSPSRVVVRVRSDLVVVGPEAAAAALRGES